jgi:hypothetical protein
MRKFKLIAQHYDMVPGTIVYKLWISIGNDVYTVNPDMPGEPHLRIIPAEKLEEIK